MVTIVTPDYIPTINTSAIIHNSSNVGKKEETKQWGRVKKVADIWTENQNPDTESVVSDETHSQTKNMGVEELRRVARLFMRSKKAAKRVRAKYSANAMRLLKNKKSSSLLDLSELGGADIDSGLFSDYSLVDMYNKLRQKKHVKLAVLQQRFINELPQLKEASVKDHLERKIRALERIKQSQYVLDTSQMLDLTEQLPTERNNSDGPSLTRRQSRLRLSVDLGASFGRSLASHSEDASYEPELPNVPLTIADVDRELALSKSRERIENELNLPGDRLARFAILKANVNKINGKFNKLNRGTKSDKGNKRTDNSEEEKPYYAPSRFTQAGMVCSSTHIPPLEQTYFRKHHFFKKYRLFQVREFKRVHQIFQLLKSVLVDLL